MKIDGRFKCIHALPEYRVLIEVEIFTVSLHVDHGTLKAQIPDTAFEFVGSVRGILHGQMRESAITIGTLLDFGGEKVVYRMRLALGDRQILFYLHAGPGEREYNKVNPILVHYGQTPVNEVHERAGRKFCDIGADVRVGFGELVHEIGDHEVLFHSNLAQRLLGRGLWFMGGSEGR